MNLFLFIIVIAISFVIVRIGAVAFQLTGIEWSVAKFQSLSCFSATGFTTKEAEMITANKQRRRIASILIILGHAGLVTMIATLANSLRARAAIEEKLSRRWLPAIPPSMVPVINLIVIVIAVYFVYRLFTNTKFAKKLTSFIRQKLVKTAVLKPVLFEELFVTAEGYAVTRINVNAVSPLLNKTVDELSLLKNGIRVIAIERGNVTIAEPPADNRILPADTLICFSKSESVKELMK